MEDTMERMSLLILAATLALVSGPPVRADEPSLSVDRNCRTTLPQDSKKAPAAGTIDADTKLSQSLAECQGVLRPPAVGDDMAVPPPKSGAKTPVLPPGSVPEQTPKG